MSDDEEQPVRVLPASDIDLQFQVTNPVWGQREVAPELIQKLSTYSINQGEFEIDAVTGKHVVSVTEEKLWGLMSFYTRDFRLANLSSFGGELAYCQYHIDLAADCLREGLITAFLTSLSRAVTVLELSQSKGGFLRKRLGTFTAEHFSREEKNEKKGLFGKKKAEDR